LSVSIILYFLFWCAYFVVHSLLASEQVKKLLGKPTWYRLFYTAMAIILLIPILGFHISIGAKQFFEPTLGAKIPALALGYTAYVFLKQAFGIYSLKAFVGFGEEHQELRTDGILARVRHPLYTATILLAIGFWLWSPTDLNLAMILSWFIYLPIGIWLEEKKLVKQYGQLYLDYREKVPAVLPKIGK